MVMWIVRWIQINFVIGDVDLETETQISVPALLRLSLCAADESVALLKPDPCLASAPLQVATKGSQGKLPRRAKLNSIYPSPVNIN